MVVNGFNSNYSAIRELIFCCAMEISGTIKHLHVGHHDQRLSSEPKPFKCGFTVYPDGKSCTKLSWVNMGMGIHGKVARFWFESNTFVRNTLTYFHANCGDLRIASALFDDLAKRGLCRGQL
ncbi:unnamed protein product [Malus baccata var. baccata]